VERLVKRGDIIVLRLCEGFVQGNVSIEEVRDGRGGLYGSTIGIGSPRKISEEEEVMGSEETGTSALLSLITDADSAAL